MYVYLLWQEGKILANGLQEAPIEWQVRNASFFFTTPQWSARSLKGLSVGISHNAFSHREMSSQHEQGRNVAGVWEQLLGGRKGGREWRRAESREHGQSKGGKKGSAQRAAVSFRQIEFLSGLLFELQMSSMRETYWRGQTWSWKFAYCILAVAWYAKISELTCRGVVRLWVLSCNFKHEGKRLAEETILCLKTEQIAQALHFSSQRRTRWSSG